MSKSNQNTRDRLVEIHIEGLRGLDDAHISVVDGRPRTDGDEALEAGVRNALDLLQSAVARGTLVSLNLLPPRGGLGALLRDGAPVLRLGVRIEGAGPPLTYTLAFAPSDGGGRLEEERLEVWEGAPKETARWLIARTRARCRVVDPASGRQSTKTVSPDQIVVSSFGPFASPEFNRVQDFFAQGVHPGGAIVVSEV